MGKKGPSSPSGDRFRNKPWEGVGHVIKILNSEPIRPDFHVFRRTNHFADV